jgi:hypothetical protein
MAKIAIKPNAKVQQIFEDLEQYLEFCQAYGYKYDESELYNQRSYVFRQFAKFASGKFAKDQWADLIGNTPR